jgi:hypothetical protein
VRLGCGSIAGGLTQDQMILRSKGSAGTARDLTRAHGALIGVPADQGFWVSRRRDLNPQPYGYKMVYVHICESCSRRLGRIRPDFGPVQSSRPESER